jgi:hypothetical protein
MNRRTLLRTATVAGAGAAAGALLVPAGDAISRPSARMDRRILGLVLVVERVQSAFYDEAVRRGKLHGELLEFAETVAGHEREHIALVKQALGGAAGAAPRTHFGDATGSPKAFARASAALEDLAVRAYNGQGTNLTPGALAAAARIVSVEARHAAWVRDIAGLEPAPAASDRPLTAAEAVAALNRTGFVRS